MSSDQKEHYKSLVEYYSNCKGVIKGTSECAGVTIMMDMRKLANHPLLMRYYYTDEDVEKLAKKLMRCPTYKGDNPQHIFEDLAYLSDFQISEIIEKHVRILSVSFYCSAVNHYYFFILGYSRHGSARRNDP